MTVQQLEIRGSMRSLLVSLLIVLGMLTPASPKVVRISLLQPPDEIIERYLMNPVLVQTERKTKRQRRLRLKRRNSYKQGIQCGGKDVGCQSASDCCLGLLCQSSDADKGRHEKNISTCRSRYHLDEYEVKDKPQPTPERLIKLISDVAAQNTQVQAITAFPTTFRYGTPPPTALPSVTVSPAPSTQPSMSNGPSGAPTSIRIRSQIPSVQPSASPMLTSSAPSSPDTAYDVCPMNRQWLKSMPSKYHIRPMGNAFLEISYMAFSNQLYQGKHRIAYVGSDGKHNKVHALYFHQDEVSGKFVGSHLASLRLEISTSGSHDWESMSLGPCNSISNNNNALDRNSKENNCIYMGDTGNNGAHSCRSSSCSNGRERVEIYKFQEPNLESIQYPGQEWSVPVSTIRLSYRRNFDRANNDAESIFVDPTGDESIGDSTNNKGDIYIITKHPNEMDQIRIGKVPVEVHASLDDDERMADPYEVLNLGAPWVNGEEHYDFTDASISPDGRLIALRTGYDVYYFPRVKGQSIQSALRQDMGAIPCPFVAPTPIQMANEFQYESVSFVGSRATMAETSECEGQGSVSDSNACAPAVYIYDLVLPSVNTNTNTVDASSENGEAEAASIERIPPLGSEYAYTTITYDAFDSTTNGDWANTNFVPGGNRAILTSVDVYKNPNICAFDEDAAGGSTASDNEGPGAYMVQLNDNSGMSSTFAHAKGHDCRGYDQLQVTFQFFGASLESMDNFMLEYSHNGGAFDSWLVVDEWVVGAQEGFERGYQCLHPKVIIDKASVGGSFARETKFRFRSMGDHYHDYIYIFDIRVLGIAFPSAPTRL